MEKNSILAAGSVLTKNVPDGEVCGGCPAKYIMTTEEYANKLLESTKGLLEVIQQAGNIKREEQKAIQEYCFNLMKTRGIL